MAAPRRPQAGERAARKSLLHKPKQECRTYEDPLAELASRTNPGYSVSPLPTGTSAAPTRPAPRPWATNSPASSRPRVPWCPTATRRPSTASATVTTALTAGPTATASPTATAIAARAVARPPPARFGRSTPSPAARASTWPQRCTSATASTGPKTWPSQRNPRFHSKGTHHNLTCLTVRYPTVQSVFAPRYWPRLHHRRKWPFSFHSFGLIAPVRTAQRPPRGAGRRWSFRLWWFGGS